MSSRLFQIDKQMSTFSQKPPDVGFNKAGVIFDLDGTLIDTAQDLAATMNMIIAREGYEPVPVETVRDMVGQGAAAMLQKGFSVRMGQAVERAQVEPFLPLFFEYYEAHIADHSTPFPGIVDLLDGLNQAGVMCGVCTNKRERPARLLLDELQLSDRFVAIVGRDTIEHYKPHPAPVRYCLQAMGLEPNIAQAYGQTVLFVGDSDTDILAAKNCGIEPIIVDFGYGPLTEQTAEMLVLDSYQNSLSLFLKKLGRSST